jgi:hypothetical protein
MTYDEFRKWLLYFERRPVGWREDNRIYHLIRTVQGLAGASNMKPWELFPSLYPIYNQDKQTDDGKADMGTLQGSALFQRMMGAKGGKKLEL